MATLREYFEKDQGGALGVGKVLTLSSEGGEPLLEVAGRLNIHFETNSLHVSFFIPATDRIECPARIVMNSVQDILDLRNGVQVWAHLPGDDPSKASEAIFTGRIYIYTENEISAENRSYILERAAEVGHSVKIRGMNYAKERAAWEKPVAFISHDSRDKESVARPLALALQKLGCPAWYDEFSLKVGDSLRGSIESGLKECRKCVLLLTPNFLANGGWAKREYDSIFTRELVERENVILPVWHGVTPKDVYDYSPILADRVAAEWEEGADEVARKLTVAVRG